MRADPARSPGSGPVARAGTAVGFSQLGDATVSTLGGQVALGYRLGPFALEAEYEYLTMLEYLEDEGTNDYRGDLDRLGVSGRLFVARLARTGDPDSVLRLFVEGGVGLQRGRWATGDRFERNDASAGGGWLLDHRMSSRRGGLPFRSIGWHFGWRLSGSRTDGDSLVLLTSCKKCRPPMPAEADIDLGLLVTCALSASW